MESLIFLVLMFLVGGVLQSLGQKNKARRRAEESLGSAPEEPEEDAGDLLAAIRKAMEAAAQEKQAAKQRRPALPQMRVAPPSRPSSPLPVDDLFSEEAESLEEVAPEVRSLEDLTPRPERVVVDHDDEISELVRARNEWAERYAKPKTPAEHRDFDRKIRQAKPVAPPTADVERHARLRQAFVWMEVLGKPVSIRDHSNLGATQPPSPTPQPGQSPG